MINYQQVFPRLERLRYSKVEYPDLWTDMFIQNMINRV
ncbi:Uncharacterized protein dnm_085200 [Desulfonema magnum]|uniref:Uncharacterized protein n=1 Tax=Desulfonema magnum TaxID=45655 RepID=A0A975BWI8_9BACT|nr:Uncharacterized protein dnm_085200 [Desulfonema magnum]